MIYRNLLLQLCFRIFFIVLLSVGMGWVIWESKHPHWAVPIAVWIVFLGYRLVRYLNSTNRLLAQFFSAVRNDDSALQIPNFGEGNSFNQLRASMHKVNQIIKDLRLKYQQKEIVSDAIIEHAAVGILSYNSNGLIECLNRKGRELLGVHHLVSIKALLQTDPRLVDLFENIKAGETRIFKTTLKQKSLHLAISCASIKFEEEEWKLLSFADIKNEVDATELESWQRLISVLTHEIMNSVAPVTSLSETLVRSYNRIEAGAVISEKTLLKTRTGLRVIQEQGEGLMHFVGNYRQLTRIPKPILKPVEVQHLFEHVKTLLALDEDERITYDFSMIEENLQIVVDEKLLMQVLLNLVQNAQHAISHQGTIKLKATRNAMGLSQIIIEDNGAGIKEEDMKNIFVPFFTTREKGSGIGLSIARQIMRLHYGKIRIESVYGVGTKVELSFA
ncbi:MAG: PAS domain-containing sensor histidine kinase [Marinifilaceae bacterium]